MSDVMQILKQTPMNNCGECGYPACMAFSVAVATGVTLISKCPHVKTDGVEGTVQPRKPDAETALLKELRKKTENIHLEERAADLGGVITNVEGKEMLELRYLGSRVFINSESIIIDDGREIEPRDQILLYNYIFFWGKGDLSGKWVGLESFPDSISKVVTLKKYTEDKLAAEFDSRAGRLRAEAESLGGSVNSECHADLCLTIPVLPRIPIQIHFWDSDPEDGFDASVKVLFDSRALDFLDIESLIFASERMAELLSGNHL
jgi:hypothetical protein